MLKNRLILFYGSSPGSGKSTLSSNLNQILTQQGQHVYWMYEDDVLHLDYFAPVVDCVQSDGGPELLDACLTATERIVSHYSESDIVVITDSLLPFYDWLIAAAIDEARLIEFSHSLWLLLKPLNPIIIYLQADVNTALNRAVAARGDAWLERVIPFMNTWGANQSKPLRDLADVIAYTQQTDQLKRRLLSQWPGDILWLDSETQSLEACVEALLMRLGLPHFVSRSAPLELPLNLGDYIGCYTACSEDPPDGKQVLTVSEVAGALWVDLYWPNGCRLVANGEHSFQLQDTSHWIQFIESGSAISNRLRYHYRGKTYTYVLQS